MEIVLVHIGDSLPNHLLTCLQQLRIFNPDITINLLVESSAAFQFSGNHTLYGAKVTTLDSIPVQFPDGCLGFPAQDFWNVTFKRLYYVHKFMEQNSLENVIHFENDVMIYFDILKYENQFKELFPAMAITVGTPTHCMTGFMYITRAADLDHMLKYMVQKIKEPNLASRYGLDMINEMTLMAVYKKDFSDNRKIVRLMDELPSLPFGPHSEYKKNFDGLFDPAAYGQYLGGTPHNGGTPGWAEDRHFIGKELRSNNIMVEMLSKDGYTVPIVTNLYNGDMWRLNSLHVHSKNLKKFLSK